MLNTVMSERRLTSNRHEILIIFLKSQPNYPRIFLEMKKYIEMSRAK